MLICLFFLIRLRLFRELLHKSAHTPKELLGIPPDITAMIRTFTSDPSTGTPDQVLKSANSEKNDRAALMLICLFFLIRLRLFRELLHKSAHTPKER
jgi:LytS/YehU family sensor histidine kinase